MSTSTPKELKPKPLFITQYFAKRPSGMSLARHDQARAARLHGGANINAHGPSKAAADVILRQIDSNTDAQASSHSVDVTNASTLYFASVGVGSPATKCNLFIDTGSSNTIISALGKYVETKPSKSTGKQVSVIYGSGWFLGNEFTDTVTLGPELVINKQSIGVVSQAGGIQLDGILGVGPTILTEGTLKKDGTCTFEAIPTVMDNLMSQKKIKVEALGIYFEPFNKKGRNLTGELTFGGVDKSKITGDVHYVPTAKTKPSSRYWGIDAESVTYGEGSHKIKILDSTSGIVDTGTTLVLLSNAAFIAYAKAIGAKSDPKTDIIFINEIQLGDLKSLFFTIGRVTYELTADAQVWPPSLNKAMGGQEGKIHLAVGSMGDSPIKGMDFVLGYTFLQRFYSVFDTTNERVGLATTRHTTAVVNSVK